MRESVRWSRGGRQRGGGFQPRVGFARGCLRGAACASHQIVGGRDGAARTDLPPHGGGAVARRWQLFRDRARGARGFARSLPAATLLSHATHDLVADRLPDGVELLDCGEHRLRDLGRPERIFALVHLELHALEPALLRSLDAVPNNLPGQLSSFVGRERELEELRPALGATRLLTLTAPAAAERLPGAGARVRVAREVPGRRVVIDLAAQADPAMVGDAIAEAIGVRPLPG